MIFLSTLLLSTLITIALVPMFRRLAVRFGVVDLPNPRKVHSTPIPRCGGVAMVFGAFIPVLFQTQVDPFLRALVISTAVIVVFGVLDDMKGLNFKKKMAAQTISALIMIFYGGVKISSLGMLLPHDLILPDWIAIPLTLIFVVGVINAINLSDGLDGLAGGICLLIFICIGYLGYRSENMVIAVAAVGVVGGIFGFLRFNTHPATLFMGDAGSQFLGLMAVSLSIKLTQGNTPLSRMLPLILLGFPVLDTLSVMFERMAHGKSPFVADKNHFHHKLMRRGLYHSEAVIAIYTLQAILVISAFFLRFHSEWVLLLSYLIFSGLILLGFFLTEKADWQLKRSSFIDAGIKGRLRFLKERDLLIVFSFRLLQMALPAILFAACFMASDIPGYLAYFTLGAALILLFTLIFFKKWVGPALRFALYLMIPFVVYLSGQNISSWKGVSVEYIYSFSFLAIAFLAILTLKFTRRTSGFKTTPMDFLILFFALVVPNIPDESIRRYHMGLVAAEIIVLFFAYDVLMGEMRSNHKWLCLNTMGALTVVSIKGFSGL
jgi:UDP-GlcNAc:undecaprenyl-phosphate/decaprenyl-phosphate GlcNAc-1-phosphate transferase